MADIYVAYVGCLIQEVRVTVFTVLGATVEYAYL